MRSTDWPAPNGPGRQNTPLYACHPEAIFVRGPNEPEPFPLLHHRLPEVPCDQSVVQQRITAHKPVRVDVDGAKGSTGVLAWRIDAI